jgi:hypothetical protein
MSSQPVALMTHSQLVSTQSVHGTLLTVDRLTLQLQQQLALAQPQQQQHSQTKQLVS